MKQILMNVPQIPVRIMEPVKMVSTCSIVNVLMDIQEKIVKPLMNVVPIPVKMEELVKMA